MKPQDSAKAVRTLDGQTIQTSRHTRPKIFSRWWFRGLWLSWFPGKLSEENFCTLEDLMGDKCEEPDIQQQCESHLSDIITVIPPKK